MLARYVLCKPRHCFSAQSEADLITGHQSGEPCPLTAASGALHRRIVGHAHSLVASCSLRMFQGTWLSVIYIVCGVKNYI